MKKTKRFFAALLAALMLTGIAAAGTMAAETPMADTGKVTIENAAAGVTYEFYRVLDISGIAADGKAAFITNAKWHTVMSGLTAYGTVHGDVPGSIFTSEGGFTAQNFAASVLAAGTGIAADRTLPVVTSGEQKITGLQYGLYVMVSSRQAADKQYVVFTLKEADFTIQEKNPQYPQLNKTVDGKNAISADFGQVLNYKIVVKAAAGTDTYRIEDTMPQQISLVSNSLAMKKVSVADKAETPLTEGTDYTVTRDAKKIEITLAAALRAGLVDGDEIIFEYQATLQQNTATLTAYRNNAKLHFKKGAADEELADDAAVFSGHISFHKRNSATNAHLAGAKFVLRNSQGEYAVLNRDTDNHSFFFGGWVDSQDDATELVTTGDGTKAHTIRGLKADTYELIETEAPSGFLKADKTTIVISENTDAGGEISGLSTPDAVTIFNTPGSELPTTGGIGAAVFNTAGGLLVACALVLLAIKRRKSA